MQTVRPSVQKSSGEEEPIFFSFAGPVDQIEGVGAGPRVPPGSSDTLPQRVRETFARMQGRGVIGGALPFQKDDPDALWQVKTARRPNMEAAPQPSDRLARNVRAEPSATLYRAAVSYALSLMGDEPEALRKVVLARSLRLTADMPFDQERIFRTASRDPSVTAFRVMLPDSPDNSPWTGRALIGATPEILLHKTKGRILSHPLAGSARRSADPEEDQKNRSALEASDKDRREHMLVVDYILDTLAPLCRDLRRPQGTTLTHTRSMWHLGTEIEGDLKDPETPSILLASLLHPTPAVCGVPCQRAQNLIAELEPVERAFYGGAVGWCDAASGDGTWYVAIRCADVCGPMARLFAGAGIVPGSDPGAEAAETAAKFGAMLDVMGLPRDIGHGASGLQK